MEENSSDSTDELFISLEREILGEEDTKDSGPTIASESSRSSLSELQLAEEEQDGFPSCSKKLEKFLSHGYLEKSVFGEVEKENIIRPKATFHYRRRRGKERKRMEKDSEEEELESRLVKEAEEIELYKSFPRLVEEPEFCACGVNTHPPEWSDSMIEKIHDYIYKLNHTGMHIDDGAYKVGENDLAFQVVLMNEDSLRREKVEDVLLYIDMELGYNEGYLRQPSNRQAYLALCDENIIGCLIAEPIEVGYKNISPPECYPKVGDKVHAKCGINRIWVFLKYRRRRIATALIDIARYNFVPGQILNCDDIAFANPILQCRYLAEKYCRKTDFIVY